MFAAIGEFNAVAIAYRKRRYLLPALSVAVIFTITFSLYFYFRGVTEENVRATLLKQYEQRQIDSAATLSKSIAADLDRLMTKLQVLSQSGPVRAGDFTSYETELLMKQIYDESNAIARIEGVGLSNSQNIVMNVYQPEIDKNQLIGQNMSSRPFVIEARNNLPSPTFSSGYETIINNQGQRMALLYPIYDQQETHIGWTRSAVDASLFFERYGNIYDIKSEYFWVLDKKGNILVSPLTSLEGKNVADEEVQKQIATTEEINEHLQKVLAGQISTAIFPEPFGEAINTGYPVVIRGGPVYFVFLVTPTVSIYSHIEDTLFASKVQTVALLAISASVISALLILLTRINLILQKTVRKRTSELESASAKLESLNNELEVKNMQLIKSNKELEEKENALEDAVTKVLEIEKEKEEFSAMITHELKTPLVPVIGYSELLLDETLGQLNEKQKETIRVMNSSAVSLSRLISDLLDVRKLELGKMKFEKHDVPAKQLVEQCLTALKPLAQAKGVTLTHKIGHESSDTLRIMCDDKRIRQVLDNLVNNAIKFSPANVGKIEVSVKKEDIRGTTLFAVKDNGTGIPKDKQLNIFQKFYQADTSLTRNAGGTGLGLAISKGIVEAHDGRIWFESEPGVGSTFYFSIPASINSSVAITG
jgi:signal transduction histidine kinase